MSKKAKLWGILILVVGLPVLGFLHYKYFSIETLNVAVADINKGVFVSMCQKGVPRKDACDEYRNEDSMWHLKLDSGKVRSRLALAETEQEAVKVRVYGYRFTWFSIRKNILSVVE